MLFVACILGFFQGQRVSFPNYQFDTRLVVEPDGRSFRVDQTKIPLLVEQALDTFLSLEPDYQDAILNALYLHGRARHLFWDWERFLHEFMVLDGMRWLLSKQHPGKWKGKDGKPNSEEMCKFLGVQYNVDSVNSIFDRRNDLAHQGLWSGTIPGFSETPESWQDTCDLGCLVERLIAGSLGIGTSFRQSSWWSRQIVFFDAD